jgi:hypothetical protein
LSYAFFVATSAGAQESQEDINAISMRNAIAQPSGDNSAYALRGRSRAIGDEDRKDFNKVIMDTISSMPKGGGYKTSPEATSGFAKAMHRGDRLTIDAEEAKPSFCSMATYLVFLKALLTLESRGEISLSKKVVDDLSETSLPDGHGIWGRWNANGPGTARLFFQLHLGDNFTGINEAKQGDFMKIFWNDEVGAKEFGHSVIFLGLNRTETGETEVQIWSSNQPTGYGQKSVPLSKIKFCIFSRLKDPARIAEAETMQATDPYLSHLNSLRSSKQEALVMCGIEQGAPAKNAHPDDKSSTTNLNGLKLSKESKGPIPGAVPVASETASSTKQHAPEATQKRNSLNSPLPPKSPSSAQNL